LHASAASALGDVQASQATTAIINYALEFARVSETYEVNSWMLLLGILRFESSTAAKSLRALGLDDMYGAWHEVLWAMNSVSALEPRTFVPEIGFADRAYHVLVGACRFAHWGGRSKVQSEDLLMALAAGGVLDGIFPDLKLSFARVRAAVEKQAGGVYVLPDDGDQPKAKQSDDEDDNFL
jgi:hypothetical protein